MTPAISRPCRPWWLRRCSGPAPPSWSSTTTTRASFSAVPGVGGTAPAAGWIKRLEARPDGIWAAVAWTEAAQARIRAGEYRYITPSTSTTRLAA